MYNHVKVNGVISQIKDLSFDSDVNVTLELAKIKIKADKRKRIKFT